MAKYGCLREPLTIIIMLFSAGSLSSTYEKYTTMGKDNFVFLEVVEGFTETGKALVNIILDCVPL